MQDKTTQDITQVDELQQAIDSIAADNNTEVADTAAQMMNLRPSGKHRHDLVAGLVQGSEDREDRGDAYAASGKYYCRYSISDASARS